LRHVKQVNPSFTSIFEAAYQENEASKVLIRSGNLFESCIYLIPQQAPIQEPGALQAVICGITS
jgi:hypothetical protein